MGHPALVRGRESDLLAAHPPVHECLCAACATQVPDLRGVGEQDIPWRQFQHRLLRSLGNEGCRLGQRQPPVFRLAPWITANIAVVSLCKRHTKHLPIWCGPHRSFGPLGDTSKQRQTNTTVFGGQSPEVVILLFVYAQLCGNVSPGRIVIDPLRNLASLVGVLLAGVSTSLHRQRESADRRYQAILAG
jgi:hypothetical protein